LRIRTVGIRIAEPNVAFAASEAILEVLLGAAIQGTTIVGRALVVIVVAINRFDDVVVSIARVACCSR
jgi:hypothetical protein